MSYFAGKFAVITGAGSGMGRELACQLAAAGCDVAGCDLDAGSLAQTKELAARQAASGQPGAGGRPAVMTGAACDVADEQALARFRDQLLAERGRPDVDLVFANAAIGGAGSFAADPREAWERVFAVNWGGVYHTARTFLPALIAAPAGVLVNTSSVNGFWASLGPGVPHTAYSTAKFAVKGFTEGLIEDLRVHAPQVRVVLVMPGHVATNIVGNSMRALGVTDEAAITAANEGFRSGAPMTAAQAAAGILAAVQAGRWRVLVGEGARKLDDFVRARPESAYDYEELASYRELARLGDR